MWNSAKNPQEKQSTTLDTERTGHKENSNKTIFETIRGNPIFWVPILLVAVFLLISLLQALVILCISVLPKKIINDVMPMYGNNSTMAQMHVDIAGNLLIFYVTAAYVIITLYLVIQSEETNTHSKKAVEQSKEAVIQSKEANAQSRSTQEIMYIQTRFEKLYYPLKIMLNKHQIVNKDSITADFSLKFKTDMDQIMPYVYLSSNKLYPCLNRFIDIFYKNSVLVVKKAYKDIEEKREEENLSEKEDKTLKLYKLFLDATSSASEWKRPSREELTEIPVLYIEIIGRINEDIGDYRNRLNELTATRADD